MNYVGRRLHMTEALALIEQEVIRAMNLHPGSNPSPRHHHSVLREEYVEFENDVFADQINNARAEAIQIAAMAIRFLMEAEGGNKTEAVPKYEDQPGAVTLLPAGSKPPGPDLYRQVADRVTRGSWMDRPPQDEDFSTDTPVYVEG